MSKKKKKKGGNKGRNGSWLVIWPGWLIVGGPKDLTEWIPRDRKDQWEDRE